MHEIAETIRTKRLEICDSRGECRISLDCWSDGTPCVRLYGSDGCERLVLTINQDDQPQVGLLDADGSLVTGLGLSNELGGGFTLTNSAGEIQLVTGVDSEGRLVVRPCRPED